MIEIKRFKLRHLVDFEPKYPFPNIMKNMEFNMADSNRECLSLMREKKLICVAGINYLRPGAGEVWLVPGIAVDKYKFEFYKTVRWLLDEYLIDHKKLHRLEMAIEDKWEKGIRWAKSLGFEREGFMKQWSPDKKDHILYARIV
tara:strand:+ start:543 stop:974 length:432 start_codon:yes stop_codon:yes gene_type:complete